MTDLLYVGRAAADTLKRFGVRTIGDLARFDREALFSLLGRHGRQLHAYANGLDRSPVSSACQENAPKSIGNGLTFPAACPAGKRSAPASPCCPTGWPSACAGQG